ncbi:MAG: uracil-DNA glycosylase [Clostridiales bacterium]|nr:uracil-DNA glycosylase [Candidatus Crickella equi]
MVKFENDWDELLQDEFKKDYYLKLRSFLINEYNEHTVYPAMDDVFNALKLTSYQDVKAVILGQDPYHEPRQAHGLAFSVPSDMQYPPSLVNIFKELEADLGLKPETKSPEGVLVPWAKEGVLLLNTALTVRAHEANSHRGKGWEQFTDAIIKLLAERDKPMVFILWGANAISKKDLIQEASARVGVKHLVITAPHPSPLSAFRGFFGGRYFSRTNYFLEDNGIEPIDWALH